MDYVFYFDESFHDRKISIKENGTINTLQDDTIDNYIGVFWGCPKEELRGNIEKLQMLENKYRKVFTLSDDKEFKSDIIGPKNYRYGVRSFNSCTMNFYKDFFAMMDDIKPIIQINAISKMEWALRRIFPPQKISEYIKAGFFYYSLTKLFVTYKPVDIIQKMYQVKDEYSLLEFQKYLAHGLKQLAITEKGIARKDAEINAFIRISNIIESMSLKIPFDNKFNFIYSPNFEGLLRLMKEIGIDSKSIKLVIDREQSTYEAALNYRFKKVSQGNSVNVIQIRFSDFISGFIGRMIRGLIHDSGIVEKQITNVEELDKAALVDKRLLSPEWFDLKEEQFDLYKLIYKVMILNCEFYWTTMTFSYCDEVCCFYTLLRYVASYQNYIDFIKIAPDLHTEYYNSACLTELVRCYQKM